MIDQALQSAIQKYFDSMYHCDTEILDALFHPASSLFDADDGEIFVDPIAAFSKAVGSRPSPASVAQKREEEVLMIDFLSPISATVKVRLRAHFFIFIDHLSFVKGKNGWQIVCKVWNLQRTLTESEA